MTQAIQTAAGETRRRIRTRRRVTEDDSLPISPEDARRFRLLAEGVLGRDWVMRLALALDVNIRTSQRWATGKRFIPDRAWDWLEAEDAKLAAMRTRSESLDTWVQFAQLAGLSPHTIVAQLRDTADQIVETVIKPKRGSSSVD